MPTAADPGAMRLSVQPSNRQPKRRRAGRRVSRSPWALVCAVVLLLAVGLPLAAAAEAGGLGRVRALAAAGDAPAALNAVDEYLAANPGDASAQFLRGVMLGQIGRGDDAIASFVRLTREHPQLPEPYNNLAVLYAARGDYGDARDALLQAISIHPGYAIAHENLGDIYARMAGIAYDRAASLDGGSETARSKLSLIDALFSAEGAGSVPTRP